MLSAFLFLFFIQTIAAQQVLVNKEWTSYTSGQYFYEKAQVKTDGASNVYTLGSTLTPTGYDWLLVKTDNTGDSLWVAQFDGDGGKDDIAINLYIDASQNVYVVGGSWQNATDSLDACIVKYNSSGVQQWKYYQAGTNPRNDLYTCVTGVSTNIIAGGTMCTDTTLQDFLVTRISDAGVHQFTTRYDYGNLNDVAVDMTASGTVIRLMGGSQTGASSYDFIMAQFSTGTGAFIKVNDLGGGSATVHSVTDLVYDASGNLYVTGSYYSPATGHDIRTTKLNDTLAIVWDELYNGADSLDDKGNGIAIDPSGNVYVTGFSTANGKDVVTIKYDASGTEQWVERFNGSGNLEDSGTDVEYNNGKVFVAGYITDASLQPKYAALCYSDTGGIAWDRSVSVGAARTAALALDNEGDVIVAGAYMGSLVSEKYSMYTQVNANVNDTAGVPLYKDNELIITFNPSKVKSSFVNNEGRKFDYIENVIDSVLINQMNAKLGFNLRSNKSVRMIKTVYQKTTDTISITRHGYQLPIPKFWATISMTIPSFLDEFAARDTLKTLAHIYDVEFDEVFFLSGANDPIYNSGDQQSSLHPTPNYPDAHINIDTAWAYDIGRQFIKLGVMDDGIWFTHQDFGTATNGSLSGSKIASGYNFVTNSPNIHNLQTNNIFYRHGTSVAGTIGALRDNNIGIAGIAGGDPDSSSKGVMLYDMTVCCAGNTNYSAGYVTDLWQALFQGATSGPNPYNGLHIMNLSLGTVGQYANDGLRQRVMYARDNGVVFVAARSHFSLPNDSSTWYPAVYNDEFLINVGGSGTDGSYKRATNGIGNGVWGSAGQNLYTRIGGNIDFVAPQAYENVSTLVKGSSNSDYGSYGGTSSSSAHVSGVVGLMLSNFNSITPSDDNLTTEDVEHILEYTAKDDIFGSATTGYDPYSGHGLIDAGEAMKVIQKPNYQVLHFTAWLDASSVVQVGTNISSPQFRLNDLGNAVPGLSGSPVFGAGDNMNIHRISGVVNHGQFISPTAQILGYWIRNTYCDAYDTCFTAGGLKQGNAHRSSVFEYFNQDSAKIVGYLYQVGVSLWLPKNPNTSLIRLSYTVHTYDSTGVTSIPVEADELEVSLYPNPAEDFVNLQFTLTQSEKAAIRLFDMNGRLVNTYMEEVIGGGSHGMQVSVSSLHPGMYFFEIGIGNKIVSKKFIKH